MSKVSLLESYKSRIAVAESFYAKNNGGAKLDNQKKMAVARLLDNTQKYLNESFENSVGTQRADMGMWRKFCLNLTTVAVPSLIAFDLVMVQPISSMSGYITYIKYTAGSNKGDIKRGHVFNSPFGLGDLGEGNYTGAKVVEVATGTSFKPAWTPVVGDVEVEGEDGWTVVAAGEDGAYTVEAGARVRYTYDNVIIPQNDLPLINAEVDHIAVFAKPRRVAVYYSQMAAFQAKQDYGFDLGDQLAEKAVGQLAYEIDTEVVKLLADNASAAAELTWSKAIPQYISMSQHYESFAAEIEKAKKIVYDATKRFVPNYMIIASDILPILTFVKGFEAAPVKDMNGPYLAGTINGVKVYVSPAIEQGSYVVGVNGNDLMSSAAVYAPYMAIVPTQLLGYADGSLSQGFSTLYGLEILNKNLLVKGKVVA
jgi:hypothetical protein